MKTSPKESPPELLLTLPSDPVYLRALRRFLLALCQYAGFGERDAKMVALAVEETWTNVIRHAYKGCTDKTIELRAALHPDQLELVLVDHGVCCAEETFQPRKREPLEPGRLGLVLVHEVFDAVQFDGSHEGENRLHLFKRLPVR